MDARFQFTSAPRTSRALASALALLLVCAPAFGNRYKLIDLGSDVLPRSINDRDEILASKKVGRREYVYLLYRGGHWREVGKSDGDNIDPVALNQRGDIVGRGASHTPGVWLNAKRFEPLGAPGGVTQLSGISESRAVAGVRRNETFSCFEMQWQGKFTKIELPVPRSDCQTAQGISENGWVAGFFNIEQDNILIAQRAFVWKGKGQAVDLGTLSHAPLANAVALDINGWGQIVGYSETDEKTEHAFVWGGGTLRDIGDSDKYPHTIAFLINNRGEIVGTGTDTRDVGHLLRFDHGEMIDLATEVVNLGAMTLSGLFGLNDLGKMVGSALLDGEVHGVVLVPD
jgi:probable HAF family extracellular repeat protein